MGRGKQEGRGNIREEGRQTVTKQSHKLHQGSRARVYQFESTGLWNSVPRKMQHVSLLCSNL